MDSLEIQQTMQVITGAGTSFIPSAWQWLTPLITALITIVTGAIIRAVEKGKLNKQHKAERAKLIQLALDSDKPELKKQLQILKDKK